MDLNYKKYLNKKDPIDNVILELIKKNKLKIGVVKVFNENPDNLEWYSKQNLSLNVKHTS